MSSAGEPGSGGGGSDGPGSPSERPLAVVSNRLPIEVERGPAGDLEVEAGAGGLVTAMAPVLDRRGGVWFGWPGTVDGDAGELREVLPEVSRETGYRLAPVLLTEEERDNFYYGFSNEILWPLFHGLQSRLNYAPDYWEAYEAVNRKYAAALAERAAEDAYVWAHDYHLMRLAAALRENGWGAPVGFFLHTPFPPPDAFEKLPWRGPILRGLLAYDLVGLQTERDRENLVRCLDRLVDGVDLRAGNGLTTARLDGRTVRIGAFPISVDAEEFESLARSEPVEARTREIRQDHPDRKLVLGVDRLDYTKGIPYRLEAFRSLLEGHPEMRGKVSLVQLVVPSREEIPEYGELKEEIERLVGEINGQFTRAGWVPIHYLYRSVERSELVALYRAASIALITPLRDGMNLVSKEFCMASVDHRGALVLSEFAGSALQLSDGAILVNPYDIEGMSEALYRAFALEREERERRLRDLRERIRREDIYWWVDRFSRAADGEPVEALESP